MKRFLCFAVLAMIAAIPCFGQSFVTGTLTATGSTCTPQNAPSTGCVLFPLGPQTGSVGVVINGTFAATLQFEQSADGGNTWVSANATAQPFAAPATSVTVSSATATGTWAAPVSAMTHFRVRCSAYTNGQIFVSVVGGYGLPGTAIVPTSGVVSPTVSIFVPATAQSATGSTQTPITASSGTLAATAGACTLPGVVGKTTYITGFQITGAGATGASVIAPTVTGVISSTMTYELAIPAGAAVGVTPLVVSFSVPVPASAVNTAIVVNIPSFGLGNTNASCVAQGFQQ